MKDINTLFEKFCNTFHECKGCPYQDKSDCVECFEAYQQGRADAIEEFRNKLFGKLMRLNLSMWHFKLFDDALQETYNELKEKNND